MRNPSDFTISGVMKILVALRFYAVGCFVQPLGDLFGISKSSACDVVAEVSFLIASKMRPHYVSLPNNPQDIKKGQVEFHRIAGFPFVIGAVDGTFIKIQSIGGVNAELYRNRKSFFSINCQLTFSASVSNISIYLN